VPDPADGHEEPIGAGGGDGDTARNGDPAVTPAWLTVRSGGCKLIMRRGHHLDRPTPTRAIIMVVKLASKKIPRGFQPSEFRYVGRPAHEQGDFGPDVGIVDMTPVDGRGNSDGSHYVHIGVVEARGEWFVYMEWARVDMGRSWFGDSPQPSLEFMFTRCRDRHEAHRFFRRQCMTMNVGRITQKRIGDSQVWAAKTDASGKLENAWIVGAPHCSDRGLPQPEPECVQAIEAPVVPVRADVLVRGILHDARIASQNRGDVPTLEALEQIGEELLPLVIRRIAELSAPGRGRVAGVKGGRASASWSAAAN
jgi:hypothetical protein